MSIVVTGATGMIGRAVAAQLVSRGEAVFALRRRAESRVPPGTVPIERDALRDALAASDALIHCAGALTVGSAFAQAGGEGDAVNEALTREMLAAAQDASVRRFVLMSSVAVYGAQHHGPIDETNLPRPVSGYGRSKLRQEEVALAAANARMAVTIIRPSIVTGPGDRHFAQALTALRRPLLMPVPRSGCAFDIAHSDDVAAVTIAAMTRGVPGQAYNATSGVAVRLGELAVAARGRRPVLALPDGLFRLGAKLAHTVLKRTHHPQAVLAGPIALGYLFDGGGHFAITRARDTLGYTPQHTTLGDVLSAVQG